MKTKQKNEGFTIIEVLIVLAIAGLILLVVFLAVPALQRNSRNTQRRNDVQNVLGGINEFIANNNGKMPTGWDTTNGEFTGGTGTSASKVNIGFYTPGDVKFNAAGDVNSIEVRTGNKCNGNALTTTGATSRNVAGLYYIETTGGTAAQCVEA